MLPWLFSAILWTNDLDVLQRELPKMHANAFHTVSREQWEGAIGTLRERAPSMRPADVAVGIARIVAMIGEYLAHDSSRATARTSAWPLGRTVV